MSFVEEMPINITKYLQNQRNDSIKKILDLLDMSDIVESDKKKLRQSILDEINNFYDVCCIALTYIQEKQ